MARKQIGVDDEPPPNMQDATLRNIRALKKQVAKLTELVRQLLSKQTKAARRAK